MPDGSCSLKTLLIIYNPNANTNNDYSDGNNDKLVTKTTTSYIT